MVRPLVLTFALVVAAGPAAPARAQAPAAVATAAGITIGEVPVFARAAKLPTPLRVLPGNTRVRVVVVRDGWVQISFDDPQWGERFGWVEERQLRIDRTATPPAAAPVRPRVAPGDASRPPLSADEPPPPAAQPQTAGPTIVAPPRPRARAVGEVSFTRMNAAQAFEAVTGSATVIHYGGGVQGVDLWKHLFIEGTFDYANADGERVFVHEGEAFQLGIPVTITMTPIDIVGGWRFVNTSVVTPYVGGGYSTLGYKETSDFADEGDDVDERFHGYVLMGGVEVRASRWIHVLGEVRYRDLPSALDGGAAAAFGETSLGGLGFAVRVAIGK